MKLIQARAIMNGYMDQYSGGRQFCTKEKMYNVIKIRNGDFMIIDDCNDDHWFSARDCKWFELIYDISPARFLDEVLI